MVSFVESWCIFPVSVSSSDMACLASSCFEFCFEFCFIALQEFGIDLLIWNVCYAQLLFGKQSLDASRVYGTCII